jgi:hypothetical protein
MRAEGLEPTDSEDRQQFARQVLDNYRRRFTEGVLSRKSDCTVFHNSGHVDAGTRRVLDTYTHLELESLPSTSSWGYNHFPISVRYARTLDKPLLGMTGKFHTAWGDFASLKNEAALEFECMQMVANNAACSVGDQLHPRGRLDPAAYDLIGRVYERVEALEPWTTGVEAETEIGVFNLEAVGTAEGRVDPSHSGALRMLLESQQQFDFVDEQANWGHYRVIILPDNVLADEVLADKIRNYLHDGGKVIASYRSGLAPTGDRFALDEFGVSYVGPAPYQPDYLRTREALDAGLADTEYAMYDKGLQVRPAENTDVLADLCPPYFNRTWEHFCSHRQTPPDLREETDYPAITECCDGNVIYFAHPIFRGYRQQAVLWYKKLFLAALDRLMPDPLVTCGGPSTLQATLLRQEVENRCIVHLLHYIPERRGLAFDTIEDVIPLYNVPLSFKVPERPARVYLAPGREELDFDYDGGCVCLTVPEVVGHAVVVSES